MRNIILLLFCCIAVTDCFSQSQNKEDSLNITPGVTFKAKEQAQNAIQPELAIYPNPAKNKITIQVKNFKPGMVAVKIMDTKGKLVREDMRLLTNGSEDIIMFLMLKEGIYFILVSAPGKTARKKLIIL
ncbi:MAG: T9SS type A sorting domain-containing protein [Ferruginibacter sp.]